MAVGNPLCRERRSATRARGAVQGKKAHESEIVIFAGDAHGAKPVVSKGVDRRSRLEHQTCRVAVLHHARHVKRRGAVDGVSKVDIGCSTEQQAHHLGVPLAAGNEEGRAVVRVQVDRRAGCTQRTRGGCVTEVAGDVQRGHAVLLGFVHGRASLDQELGRLCVATPTGNVERRATGVVGSVYSPALAAGAR